MVDRDKQETQNKAYYTPEEEALRLKKLRRKIYTMAREYWAKEGNTERLVLTDEDLDEQFWLIDHQGIPRLKSEIGQVELPEDPLEDLIGILDTDITDLSESTRNIYD